LILNDKAACALVLRDHDGLVCVGAFIAQTVFPESKVLDIVQVLSTLAVTVTVDKGGNGTTEEDPVCFETMLAADPKFGAIQEDGSIVLGPTMMEQDVMERIKKRLQPRENMLILSLPSHIWIHYPPKNKPCLLMLPLKLRLNIMPLNVSSSMCIVS
jgi:hypothetical protein